VKLFKNFNFATSTIMMFLVGIVSFSATILMPQFLQTLMGYTAEKAGLVVSAGAALLLVEMPVVGLLTSKFPVKYLMALGWLMSSAGLYVSVKLLSLDINFGTAALIMLMQYVPLGFIFIPATTAAYIGVPHDKSNAVSGLVNFSRNIGSSVGTSVMQTILARKAQLHQVRLSSHTALGDGGFLGSLNGIAGLLHLQSGVGQSDGQSGALAQLYRALQAQASVLSYMDAYFLLGVAAAFMFFLSFVLRKNNPRATEQHAGH
jgi:DHA2 family multidrug resistance protein